jgi:hypothetical protein
MANGLGLDFAWGSESGFSGLEDFQDYPHVFAMNIIQRALRVAAPGLHLPERP